MVVAPWALRLFTATVATAAAAAAHVFVVILFNAALDMFIDPVEQILQVLPCGVVKPLYGDVCPP